MRDRFEIRLTVATDEVNLKALKALKPVVDFFESKLDRIAEALTKYVENEVEKTTKPKEDQGL